MESSKVAGGTDKAGPSHLAFHPAFNVAYTSDERGNSITAYRFDPAHGLSSFQTLSTLPADFEGQNTTAELKVHPSGKFLWVSNRGHDSLAAFAIDAHSGKLKPLEQTPTEKTLRSFDLSPNGRFLIAAGEGSGKLLVYQVDLETGKLTLLHTYEVGKSLTCVLAIENIPFRGMLGLDPGAGDPKDLQQALQAAEELKQEMNQSKDDRWPLGIIHLIIKNPGTTLLIAGLIAGGAIVLGGLLLLWDKMVEKIKHSQPTKARVRQKPAPGGEDPGVQGRPPL